MSSDEVVTIPAETPVETVIARHIARRAIYVGPPLVLLFGLIHGWAGAGSAALGVLVVVGNFLLAGALLTVALRISLAMYQAAALFGFFLRLGLIMVTMLVLDRLIEIERLSFGISTVISYMVLLAMEAVAVSRGKERDLDWSR
jgi:hypothetical protein